MFDNIPIEIVEQVLLRLPIQSLLKCSSICKKWYNLITSTNFISTHLHFTKSLPNTSHLFIEYIYVEDSIKCDYVVYSDDKSIPFEKHVTFTLKNPLQLFKLVGSCNGLICLDDFTFGSICNVVLWNPIIRRAVRLPKSEYLDHKGRKVPSRTLGFMFDPIANDYKVLRIHEGGNDSRMAPKVEVFRTSTGLWEDISRKACLYSIYCCQVVGLKGKTHWIGKDYRTLRIIITFDVHEEVFGSIDLPFEVMIDDGKIWLKDLLVFEECLFLICGFTRDVHGKVNYSFDVWRMGEYGVVESWKKEHTTGFDDCVIPLGFRKNGEMLWAMERKLISTNLVDASHNYLGSCPYTNNITSCVYGESLVLLGKSLSTVPDGRKLEILPEHKCFKMQRRYGM